MNILVIGGSGFIGTRLVECLLKDGHDVKIYDKSQSNSYPEKMILGDVRDLNLLSKSCFGIDLIYNLAAEHKDDVTPKSLYRDVNVGGAENIIIAARNNNIKKIIFTSTVAVYGLDKAISNESVKPEPFNEYGKTKLEAEDLFLKWSKEDEQNILLILRPSVVFGEGNRGNVYNLINQIKNGRFLMVGSGTNKKSMSYVGNISEYLALNAVKHKPPLIINYCDSPNLTSGEIINIIYKELNIQKKIIKIPYIFGLLGGYVFDIMSILTNKKFSISSVRIKKFCAETIVDNGLLNKSGHKASTPLNVGLKRMIQSVINSDDFSITKAYDERD